jgi:hypothetical protein
MSIVYFIRKAFRNFTINFIEKLNQFTIFAQILKSKIEIHEYRRKANFRCFN